MRAAISTPTNHAAVRVAPLSNIARAMHAPAAVTSLTRTPVPRAASRLRSNMQKMKVTVPQGMQGGMPLQVQTPVSARGPNRRLFRTRRARFYRD